MVSTQRLTKLWCDICINRMVISVLVYSEFAGCSTDFKGALIVNPYDADKVAESINIALTMSSTTKQVGRSAGGEGVKLT